MNGTTRFAALVATLAILALCGAGCGGRPQIKRDGGTVLVYEVDENDWNAADVDKKVSMRDSIRSRFAPHAKQGVQAEISGPRIKVEIPGDDPELVSQARSLLMSGNLELLIVANATDHANVIELARASDERIVRDGDTVGRWVKVGRSPVRGEGMKVAISDLVARDAAKKTPLEFTPQEIRTFGPRRAGEVEWLEEHRIEGVEALVVVNAKPALNVQGHHFLGVHASFDENAKPCVNFTMTEEGAVLLNVLSSNNLSDAVTRRIAVVLDDELLTAPTVQSPISDYGRITGNFSHEEVKSIVTVLRAGRLPFRLSLVSEKKVPKGNEVRQARGYNLHVPSADPPAAPRSFLRDPVILGTLCGLASSLAYTAANTCLKAVSHCDPIWVSCIKAFPTVLLVAPWLVVRAYKGEPIFPPARVWGAIVFAGVVGQLIGNVAFQWSLGIVGLALEVPLTLGTMIVAGPLLGRLALGEPISLRAAVSIGVLIVAVCVLSFGVHQAPVVGSPATASGWALVAAGVAAACLAGVAYAVLGVVIRYGVTGQASLSTTLVTVGVIGVVGLGGLSIVRIGPVAMWCTPWQDLAMMLLAGVCNAAAFLTLTKALQLAPIVYVNALNATQAAMAFLAGAMLFGEPISGPMVAGLLLTMLGLVVMRQTKRTNNQ